MSYTDTGLISASKIGVDNFKVTFEDNYFENVTNINSEFPTVTIGANQIQFKNSTLKNAVVSTFASLVTNNALI